MKRNLLGQFEIAAAVVILVIAAAFAVPREVAAAAPAGAHSGAALAEIGPTWAWMAALCVSVIGALLAAVAAVFMWALNGKIDSVHSDLTALKQRLDRGDARFAAIEAQRGEDRVASERRLTAMETRMSGVLDELKHAARQHGGSQGGVNSR